MPTETDPLVSGVRGPGARSQGPSLQNYLATPYAWIASTRYEVSIDYFTKSLEESTYT